MAIPPRSAPTSPGKGTGVLHDNGASVTIHNPHTTVIPANVKVLIFQAAGGNWTIDKVLS
jgi:hypothetical protein